MAPGSKHTSTCVAEMERQAVRDELIAKLDEVDIILRDQIVKYTEGNGHTSQYLSCLMRCRADLQSAITCLLGCSA